MCFASSIVFVVESLVNLLAYSSKFHAVIILYTIVTVLHMHILPSSHIGKFEIENSKKNQQFW